MKAIRFSQVLKVIVVATCGRAITAATSYFSERSAVAAYPDIMGCEEGCPVLASGWPAFYVLDYPGMSVVNTANLSEVVFAADRFLLPRFLIDVGFWSFCCLVGLGVLKLLRRKVAGRKMHGLR